MIGLQADEIRMLVIVKDLLQQKMVDGADDIDTAIDNSNICVALDSIVAVLRGAYLDGPDDG